MEGDHRASPGILHPGVMPKKKGEHSNPSIKLSIAEEVVQKTTKSFSVSYNEMSLRCNQNSCHNIVDS